MSAEERRRYFRIDDTVGLSIRLLDHEESSSKHPPFAPNAVELVSQFNPQIKRLIDEMRSVNEPMAELASLLNKKMDKLTDLLAMESSLVDRIAHRVQQVNISACGLAFSHEDPIAEGSRIQIELTLFPKEIKVVSEGIVVACELTSEDAQNYYCRVDFYGMATEKQELLIQHIVQSQGAQLKSRRNS
jgi:c-di-GMP-binding flagellar brake protein YcgR